MHRGNTITGFELIHPFANLMNDTSMFIALVSSTFGSPIQRSFPGHCQYLKIIKFASNAHQSLGLLAAKAILVTTCPGPALGIGLSMIFTFGPLDTIASFIVLIFLI
jgi:hypothetical protein